MQELTGIAADLTCLGKILGGGLPLAAFGGRSDMMDKLSPIGGVYQAGTLSGNPLAVAAGLATLRELGPKSYVHGSRHSARGCRRSYAACSAIAACPRCSIAPARC